MIIWFVLFLIIVIASFVLAFLSMRDYQEIPTKRGEQSVYLIQNPLFLNEGTLGLLHQLTVKEGTIISLEKLFKGDKIALLIFGPKPLLDKFVTSLNLLELEDYTQLSSKLAGVAWEVGKKGDGVNLEPVKVPPLEDNEQVWFQLVSQAHKNGFRATARMVVLAGDQRAKSLQEHLKQAGGLVKIPRPYTTIELLELYRKRTLVPLSETSLNLSSKDILALLG